MVLFLLSMVGTLVGALALTRLARPGSLWALICVFTASWWALVVVVSECVGRVSFTGASVGGGCVVAGLAGALVLRVTEKDRRVRVGAEVRVALRTPHAKVLVLAWVALMVYSVVSVWVLSATVPDVVRYHLPQAVAWVREARVGVVPELDYRANYFPHNAQIVHAFVLVLTGGHRFMGMPSVVFSGVLWVSVCALAMRACGLARRWALVFALVASSVGPVLLQMRSEMPDVAHVAALVLALVIAVDQRRHFGRAWLAFAVAAGLAVGSKSSGPLVALVLVAAWGAGSVRAHGWSVVAALRAARAPRVLGMVLVSIVVGGWVFAENLLTHGNPVFPMALKIGPVVLPGPEASSGITMNPWIYDFGASPIERVVGGVARWPRLLMHMPPFDDMTRPAASGFGYVVPVCLCGAVLGVIGAATRGRIGSLVKLGRARGTMVMLIGALLAYNALFLSFVSLITAPHSTVDARYQLHLALVAVLLVCWSGSAAKRWVRVAWAWGLVLVSLVMMHKSVDHEGHRGWWFVETAMREGHPPEWAFSGRPAFITSDPAAMYELLRDGDVIVFGRGWAYPYMFPDLTRRVYAAGGKGPHVSVVDALGIDEGTMLRLTERSHERYRLQAAHDDWEPLFDAYNARWMREGGRELLEEYFVMLARRTGATHLVSRSGRHPWFDTRDEWSLVLEDANATGTRKVAVYRFVGGDRVSDESP